MPINFWIKNLYRYRNISWKKLTNINPETNNLWNELNKKKESSLIDSDLLEILFSKNANISNNEFFNENTKSNSSKNVLIIFFHIFNIIHYITLNF